MTDLPDPLTPPDCDLRGYDWMALLGDRLFKSTFYRRARKDPRAGLAGIKLWWEAMLQKPAGSLPNDEEDLCMLADFGEDMKAWRKHRDVAMHGWILCSDGRLYHSVVAEQVISAWEKRQRSKDKRETDAERLRRWRAGKNGHPPDPDPDGETLSETRFTESFETPRETRHETRSETRSVGRKTVETVQDLEEEKESKGLLTNSSSFSEARARVSADDRSEARAEFRAYLARKGAASAAEEPIKPSDKIVVLNHVGKVRRAMASTAYHAQGKRAVRNQEQQTRELKHGPPELVPEIMPPQRIREAERSWAEQYAQILGISLDEANEQLGITPAIEGCVA